MNTKEFLELFGKTTQTRIISFTSMYFGILLLALNQMYFQFAPKIYSIINLFSAFLILGPVTIIKYIEYRKDRELESRLPDFFRDVAEAIRSGMTLPQAIKHVMYNNYGALSPYVRQLGAQIDWGIPFEKVFKKFAENTKNKVIKRSISTVIETHRSGGNISDTLTAVVESLNEINKLQQERMAHVYSQIITGYMIYLMFLGIMIGMLKFLMPGMIVPETSEANIGMQQNTAAMALLYKEMFKWLVIIEGVFSGLAIGKMSEGSIVGGIKHSLVLSTIGYMAFILLV